MGSALLSQKQIRRLSSLARRLDAHGLKEESRTLREVLAEIENSPRELSASAAARILEVTPQTVRNWVRGAVLPGRKDRTGHFHVGLDSLTAALELRRVLPGGRPGALTEDEIDAEIEGVRTERRARAARGR